MKKFINTPLFVWLVFSLIAILCFSMLDTVMPTYQAGIIVTVSMVLTVISHLLSRKHFKHKPIVEPPLLEYLPVGYRSWLEFYSTNFAKLHFSIIKSEIFIEEHISSIEKIGDTPTGTAKGALVRYDLNQIKARVLDEVYFNLLDRDELKCALHGLSYNPGCDKVSANAKEKIFRQIYLLR